MRPARPLEEKIIWMNIMCIFARVVGAARDRNCNSFMARSSEKVAHYWFRQNKTKPTYLIITIVLSKNSNVINYMYHDTYVKYLL